VAYPVELATCAHRWRAGGDRFLHRRLVSNRMVRPPRRGPACRARRRLAS